MSHFATYNNVLTDFFNTLTIPEKSFLVLLKKYPKPGLLGGDVFVYPYAVGLNAISQHLKLKGLATDHADSTVTYALRLTTLGELVVDNYLYADPLMRARKNTLISMVKGEALNLSKKFPR